jgi:hypothetical protein
VVELVVSFETTCMACSYAESEFALAWKESTKVGTCFSSSFVSADQPYTSVIGTMEFALLKMQIFTGLHIFLNLTGIFRVPADK